MKLDISDVVKLYAIYEEYAAKTITLQAALDQVFALPDIAALTLGEAWSILKTSGLAAKFGL